MALLQTGRHIKTIRTQRGIRLSELARLLGYGNINRGVQRLHVFESEGIITEELLKKVVEVLGVPAEDLKRLIEKDRIDLHRRFEEWCRESEPPHLVIRLIPGVYKRKWVPDSVPAEQVEEYASTTAAEGGKKTCLVLNRRESVWFDEGGRLRFRQTARPDNPVHFPYMTV
jgi:transcriptional regulator with XRE-family HTH domain